MEARTEESPEYFNPNASPAPAVADFTREEDIIYAARQILRKRLLDAQSAPGMFSVNETKDYFRMHFAGYQREAFAVVFLDAQHRVIGIEELFAGTLAQVAVYPREIARSALAMNAAAVILSHNHPSGTPDASRSDETLTGTVRTALALLDIRVLDHIIVAHDAVFSFVERGLL